MDTELEPRRGERGQRRGGIAALLLLLSSCAAATPVEEPARSIERVLAEDAVLGAVRNDAPRHMPLAQAVRDYAGALDALDLSACPEDFRRAMRRHIAAWWDVLPYVEGFPSLRGEMHDVFDQIHVASNPTADEFQRLVDAIWETWAPVERIALQHGAVLP